MPNPYPKGYQRVYQRVAKPSRIRIRLRIRLKTRQRLRQKGGVRGGFEGRKAGAAVNAIKSLERLFRFCKLRSVTYKTCFAIVNRGTYRRKSGAQRVEPCLAILETAALP